MTGTETATQGTQQKKKPSYSHTVQLMHAVGARKFTPLPSWQHEWQFGEGESMLHRMWSYLVKHTFASAVGDDGSAWAITFDAEGNAIDITLEDVAQALGWDEANTRRTWREGVERGIWRNGTKPAAGEYWPGTQWRVPTGRHKLILCGVRPPKAADKPDEQAPPEEDDWLKKVCTDLFPPYLAKRINSLAFEQRVACAKLYLAIDKAEDSAIAETVAAIRSIFASKKDTTLSTFGLQRIHPQRNGNGKAQSNGHSNGQSNGHTNGHSNGQEHSADPKLKPIGQACLQAVLPLVERSVQTFEESVQGEFEAAYKAKPEVSTKPASLLSETALDKPQTLERASGSIAPQQALRKPPVERKSERNLQPAVEEPTQLSPEEKAAIDLLFLKMREYQNAFPHTRFGYPLVDPENKADMSWARNVLSHVGAADMDGFVYDVGERLGARDRNSLGKLPGTPAGSPEKRYIGLILEWAKDWKRGAAERERRLLEHREAKARREELIRKQEEHAQQQTAKWDQTKREFAALPESRLTSLRSLAKAEIKADPQVSATYNRMSPAQKSELVETYAMRLLARDANAGGGSC